MEELDEAMKETVQAMKAIYQMLADPELGDAIAKMYRNTYLALCREGFSSADAMSILVRINFDKKG